jgi:hypothetical protein
MHIPGSAGIILSSSAERSIHQAQVTGWNKKGARNESINERRSAFLF